MAASALAQVEGGQAQFAGGAGMSASDLAELVGAFNDVTAKLQETHEQLRGEVGRLQRELTEARSQLRRARELAALGEMAAGIAHEVRNPLVSIRLFGEALVTDLGDRPGERELAGKIVRSVDRLNAVVGDVLNFARDLKVQREPVSAATLLHDVVEATVGFAQSVGVEVAVSVDESLSVPVDRGLMLQAIVNVVCNACEASAEVEGGAKRVEVHIEGRRGRTPQGGSRPELAICVSDTGPGFPPEVRDRVFNPFFTTRETGTGLGLAIVHRILDAHDGGVVLGDRVGGGATVELRVPLEVGGVPAGDAQGELGIRSFVTTSEA